MTKNIYYKKEKSKKIWTRYYSSHDLQTRFIRFLDNNYFSHAFALSLKETLPERGEILEAGCGEGIISARLAKKGYKVTLLDISKQALHEAKNNIKKFTGKNNSKNVNYVEGDIFKLPFDKNKFDIVWNQGVLEHFTEPEKAIEQMYRVTKPMGRVAVLVPYIYSPLHLYDILLRKLNLERFWPFEDQIFYSKKLLAKQLNNATSETPTVKLIPFALGFSIIGFVTKTKSS